MKLSERWGFVGRVDRTRSALGAVETFETLALGALVYEPHPGVRLMPNFVLTREDQVDESDLLGRVTLEVRF